LTRSFIRVPRFASMLAIELLGGVPPRVDSGKRSEEMRLAYEELHRLSRDQGRLKHARCLEWGEWTSRSSFPPNSPVDCGFFYSHKGGSRAKHLGSYHGGPAQRVYRVRSWCARIHSECTFARYTMRLARRRVRRERGGSCGALSELWVCYVNDRKGR
jgi:hypothetical protein